MNEIRHVHGIEIPDSRGNPTVAAEAVLASGARGAILGPEVEVPEELARLGRARRDLKGLPTLQTGTAESRPGP